MVFGDAESISRGVGGGGGVVVVVVGGGGGWVSKNNIINAKGIKSQDCRRSWLRNYSTHNSLSADLQFSILPYHYQKQTDLNVIYIFMTNQDVGDNSGIHPHGRFENVCYVS